MSLDVRCPLCQQSFPNTASRLLHLQTCVRVQLALPRRETRPEPRPRRQIASCPLCHEVFISRACLQRHRQEMCPIAQPIPLHSLREHRERSSQVEAKRSLSSGDLS